MCVSLLSVCVYSLSPGNCSIFGSEGECLNGSLLCAWSPSEGECVLSGEGGEGGVVYQCDIGESVTSLCKLLCR